MRINEEVLPENREFTTSKAKIAGLKIVVRVVCNQAANLITSPFHGEAPSSKPDVAMGSLTELHGKRKALALLQSST
jgi:hypothetical protein